MRAFLDEAGRQPRVSMFFEWRMRHADGSWRDVEGVATNLEDETDVGGIVLTMRDITERKSLEEQLGAPGIPRCADRSGKSSVVPGSTDARAQKFDATRHACWSPVR